MKNIARMSAPFAVAAGLAPADRAAGGIPCVHWAVQEMMTCSNKHIYEAFSMSIHQQEKGLS